MTDEQTCSVCGKPEGERYKPTKGIEYVCGTCVQRSINMPQNHAGQKQRRKQPTHHFDPVDFKRGYIRALFLGDERWITALTKYGMLVPGNPKSQAVIARDIALKNELAEQVHPDTYQQRKAYYETWLNAKCCADDCDRYCDECHGIRFEPVPTSISKPFDLDVRRFIEKYQRFWLKSEQDKALKDMRGGVAHGDGREVSDQADGNDVVWDGKRKGVGRPGQFKEDSGNPYQTQQESFLCPRFGGVAFEKSFEYRGL